MTEADAAVVDAIRVRSGTGAEEKRLRRRER